MADLSGVSKGALRFWGVIQSSVSKRVTTGELWTAMKSVAETRGFSMQGVTIQDVNALRSAAAGLRNATEGFDTAPGESLINSSMVAGNVNSAPLADQALFPEFTIRFQAVVSENGVEKTVWRRMETPGDLFSMSKDELLAQAEVVSQVLAGSYGQESLGVTGIEISAV